MVDWPCNPVSLLIAILMRVFLLEQWQVILLVGVNSSSVVSTKQTAVAGILGRGQIFERIGTHRRHFEGRASGTGGFSLHFIGDNNSSLGQAFFQGRGTPTATGL